MPPTLVSDAMNLDLTTTLPLPGTEGHLTQQVTNTKDELIPVSLAQQGLVSPAAQPSRGGFSLWPGPAELDMPCPEAWQQQGRIRHSPGGCVFG